MVIELLTNLFIELENFDILLLFIGQNSSLLLIEINHQ